MSKKEKIQYYTMPPEKYMELVAFATKDYYILSDLIKDYTNKINPEDWNEVGVCDLLETFIIVNSFKALLEYKMANPSKEEIDFALKNNIKDVLLTEADLFVLNKFNKTVEEQKELLQTLFKINLLLN